MKVKVERQPIVDASVQPMLEIYGDCTRMKVCISRWKAEFNLPFNTFSTKKSQEHTGISEKHICLGKLITWKKIKGNVFIYLLNSTTSI